MANSKEQAKTEMRGKLAGVIFDLIQDENENVSTIAGYIGPEIEYLMADAAMAVLKACGDKQDYLERESLLTN